MSKKIIMDVWRVRAWRNITDKKHELVKVFIQTGQNVLSVAKTKKK